MNDLNDSVIRKYISSDKASVVELLILNTPAFFEPSEQKLFENYLEKLSDNYFVLENDAKEIVAVGGINLHVDSTDSARLAWDIVHPNYQRKGLGTKLLKFRLNQIHKNYDTIKKVYVRTSQFVYNFYEKEGFELMEIQDNYWADGYHLYKLVYTF